MGAATYVILGLLAAAASGCGHRISPQERAAAARFIEEQRAQLGAADEARRQALATTTLEPRPDLGTCPIDLGFAWGSYRPAMALRIASGLDVVEASQLPAQKGQRLTYFELLADNTMSWELREDYKSDRPDPGSRVMAQLREAADGTRKASGTLIADLLERPTVRTEGGETTYASGRIAGRFFVWDPAKREVVCAARVDARLTGDVEVVHQAFDVRDTDSDEVLAALKIRGLQEALARVARAGPARTPNNPPGTTP
jgi:hypothetical protein